MSLLLSLVVPAYAEEAVIGGSLATIKKFFDDNDLQDVAEVIVVSADSDDHTHEIVNREIKKFKHHQFITPGPRVGKGRDVRLGMQAASGEYIVFTDADLATPLKHLLPMMDWLKGGSDVVIGVRDLAKIHDGFRYYMSNMSNILIQLVLLPGVKDSQCGFKGFSRSAADAIFSRTMINGWGFDMEVLKIAREHAMVINEVQIPDWSDPKLEDSLVGDSPVRAMIKTFKELWQIRMNSWKRKYK